MAKDRKDPIQKDQGQILSLIFWNFLKIIKIIEKKLHSSRRRYPKVGKNICQIFSHFKGTVA